MKFRILIFIMGVFIISTVSRLKGQSELTPLHPELEWDLENSESIWILNHAVVIDSKDKSISIVNKDQEIVLMTPKGQAFAGASFDQIDIAENFGSFRMNYGVFKPCDKFIVESVKSNPEKVEVSGAFQCHRQKYPWKLSIRPHESPTGVSIHFETDPKISRTNFHMISSPDEHIWGGGAQYSHFNLKNKNIPLWVSEQGIGRGQEPLTTIMNLIARSGGSDVTTYYPAATFITSQWRGFFSSQKVFSHWDFRNPEWITLDYWSPQFDFFAHRKASPRLVLKDQTLLTGRQPPLPDWIHKGAILGLQGGTQKVLDLWESVQGAGATLSAVWIQDWVGQRKTSIGKQLWWDWKLDFNHYKDFDVLKSHLENENIFLLGYINPMLVETSTSESLLNEAKNKGFLIKDSRGHYEVSITSFDAFLVNLFDPNATRWLEEIIERELLGNGFKGWMADFGEAFPGKWLQGNKMTTGHHNLYAEKWSQINSNIVTAKAENSDLVIFHRSGFTESPKTTGMFWLGDQMTNWSSHDGLASTVTALLSSGVSGAAITHSDIGGYTSIDLPLIRTMRSEELMQRWMELNAFTPIFRSHEGNLPDQSLQVYSNPTLLDHFVKFSKAYSQLFEYRKSLLEEYQQNGTPLLRPFWLQFPEEKLGLQIENQFFLGPDILVAPVLTPNSEEVAVLFPKGKWIHLLTGEEYSIRGTTWKTIPAPLGKPAAFIRHNSIWAEALVDSFSKI